MFYSTVGICSLPCFDRMASFAGYWISDSVDGLLLFPGAILHKMGEKIQLGGVTECDKVALTTEQSGH